MKKKILFLGTALLATVALSGCNSKVDDDFNGKVTEEEYNKVIEIICNNEDSNFTVEADWGTSWTSFAHYGNYIRTLNFSTETPSKLNMYVCKNNTIFEIDNESGHARLVKGYSLSAFHQFDDLKGQYKNLKFNETDKKYTLSVSKSSSLTCEYVFNFCSDRNIDCLSLKNIVDKKTIIEGNFSFSYFGSTYIPNKPEIPSNIALAKVDTSGNKATASFGVQTEFGEEDTQCVLFPLVTGYKPGVVILSDISFISVDSSSSKPIMDLVINGVTDATLGTDYTYDATQKTITFKGDKILNGSLIAIQFGVKQGMSIESVTASCSYIKA